MAPPTRVAAAPSVRRVLSCEDIPRKTVETAFEEISNANGTPNRRHFLQRNFWFLASASYLGTMR